MLLTRARGETVIWVPNGSQRDEVFHDCTRDAVEMDALARYFIACGARSFTELRVAPARVESAALL